MDAELTWANLMARTHEAPDGFSSTKPAQAHFTTSVDVGNHIAKLVLARCEAAASRHGIEQPWIVDVGAGSGRLLAQLIALGFPADRLIGVDVRPAPDLPVHWIQGVAPACVPPVQGLLFAHEFLDDVPVDVVAEGQVVDHRGTPIGPAHPDDLAWLQQWAGSDSGVVGRRRDEAWRTLVSRVAEGEAIAVDYTTTEPVGHWRGRRAVAAPGRTSVRASTCGPAGPPPEGGSCRSTGCSPASLRSTWGRPRNWRCCATGRASAPSAGSSPIGPSCCEVATTHWRVATTSQQQQRGLQQMPGSTGDPASVGSPA